MRLILITFLLTFSMLSTKAQGIYFQNTDFETARKLAEQEDKLLFIDFYTVWCGPCKMLAKTVFTQPQIGEFFNKEFVCCKLDAEKEGKELAIKLGVSAYPTLMFVNSDVEVVNKLVGSVGAEKLLDAGKNSVVMKNDPNSYANLKKAYPNHRKDEAFLAKYIPRMVEFSESPMLAIEDYLSVQTSIKENYAEMMEFFINYSKYLICGGKTEEIFNRNYEEYMDIATRSESRKLKMLPTSMVNNTYRTAMINGDAALYEIFIDRWKKLPEKNYASDYNAYKLELIGLKKQEKLYLQEAEKFLDSLTSARTVADIRYKDSVHYIEYCANNKGFGMFGEAAKQANKDLDAGIQVRHICKVVNNYLKLSNKKDGYKKMHGWVAYGKQLAPDNNDLAEMEVRILLKQGKKKEAIAAKEKLIAGMHPKDKGYAVHQAELKKMKGE